MFHILTDTRVNCYSIMTSMPIGQYLDLVKKAYDNKGGIDGQRTKLKTKTAVSIRDRLVADIQEGAVIPPVVVGVLLPEQEYRDLSNVHSLKQFLEFTSEKAGEDGISIIDGMQRTTAMLEAHQKNTSTSEREVRVEFWVAQSVNSLIYRMLVLNTGQVPWEIGRQLETVYGQFLTQIKAQLGTSVSVSIFDTEDKRRRVEPGMYQSKSIIELLLIFSSRKMELDIKDRVAEDFARLDAIEQTSHSDFIEFFTKTLRIIFSLDKEFSRYSDNDSKDRRFKSGRDIFSSFPALVGFCAMVSHTLFDEPGFDIDWDAAREKMKAVETAFHQLTQKMHTMDTQTLGNFLELDLLNERLNQPSGQVGRFERDFFRKAFLSMFRNADRLPTLKPCWLA
jgi:hypothetical protein